MATKKINKKEILKPKAKKLKSKTVKKANLTKKKTAPKRVAPKKKEAVALKEQEAKIKKTVKKAIKKAKDDDQNFAKWTAPEHIKTLRDMVIYYLSAALAIIAVVHFVLQGSFIPVLTFMMMLVVLGIYMYQEPRDVEYKIDLDGISIDDKLYRYRQIRLFQVIEDEEYSVLKFELKNSVLPIKTIYLIDQDPLYIRAVLDNFLYENELTESLLNFEKEDDIDDYVSDDELYDYMTEKRKDNDDE
ncbi:MAG: hypothetical protein KAI71_03875 [Candidatus Pacebacteria bacterium]|nr:hypothetical protein [Candidatus Paceibacterota bacterium]